jgi:membrane protease subunit HflK
MRRRLLRLLPLIALIAWLLTGVKEVGPGEIAVVRRFGRVLDVRPRAGLWIGFPWGIDRVDRIPIETERRVSVGYRPGGDADTDTPPGQLLTGDRNLVNVAIALYYVVDADAVVTFLQETERNEEVIARTAEATLTQWVAARSIEEVLLRGKTLLPDEFPELLQSRLGPCGLGIKVRRVDVSYLEPPEEVKPEFAGVAEAQAQARTTVQKANEEAETKEREARAKVRKLDDEGDVYAANRIRDARKEATVFEARLAAYQANPLVREVGRWEHLLKQVRRLVEAGQLHPLDPGLDSPLQR